MRYREDEKEALAMEILCGKLSKEEEMFLKKQIVEKVEIAKSLQAANEESNKRFLAMEGAFSQLKQITGVSSLVDMHEKFSNQRGSKLSLLEEVRDAEARLEAVKTGQAMHNNDPPVHEIRPSNSVTAHFNPTAASIGLLSDTAVSTSHDSDSRSSSRSSSSSSMRDSQPALSSALAISSLGPPGPSTSSQVERDVKGMALSLSNSMSLSLSLSRVTEQTQTEVEEFSREENNQ